MQDVYKAKDELVGDFVALKTPQAGQTTKRFKNSAQLSARVNHHNVAKTLDYFEIDNTCYLIEELVEGQTLEDATLAIMPQLDPPLAAHLFLRLAKGLAASHTAQVAHRDLKPSNVLIQGGLNLTEVKISDFGIATLAEELFEEVALKGDLTRSTSGTIRGALPYMAPEMMFRGPGDQVGKEADIWSLGAMMFRLLTGIYPFGEAMFVPVNIQNRTRAPWPSFMTVRGQFSPLARSLMDIVEECLSYDKDARPSAAELVRKCDDLCFFWSPRELGTIESINGQQCFLRSNQDRRRIFFHATSTYGQKAPRVGAKVLFSSHSGAPYPRAHPVVVLT
jgi:serine/threonine-protein kinase